MRKVLLTVVLACATISLRAAALGVQPVEVVFIYDSNMTVPPTFTQVTAEWQPVVGLFEGSSYGQYQIDDRVYGPYFVSGSCPSGHPGPWDTEWQLGRQAILDHGGTIRDNAKTIVKLEGCGGHGSALEHDLQRDNQLGFVTNEVKWLAGLYGTSVGLVFRYAEHCSPGCTTQFGGDPYTVMANYVGSGLDLFDRRRLGWITNVNLVWPSPGQTVLESVDTAMLGSLPKGLQLVTPDGMNYGAFVEVRNPVINGKPGGTIVTVHRADTIHDIETISVCTLQTLPLGKVYVDPDTRMGVRLDAYQAHSATISVLPPGAVSTVPACGAGK